MDKLLSFIIHTKLKYYDALFACDQRVKYGTYPVPRIAISTVADNINELQSGEIELRQQRGFVSDSEAQYFWVDDGSVRATTQSDLGCSLFCRVHKIRSIAKGGGGGWRIESPVRTPAPTPPSLEVPKWNDPLYRGLRIAAILRLGQFVKQDIIGSCYLVRIHIYKYTLTLEKIILSISGKLR